MPKSTYPTNVPGLFVRLRCVADHYQPSRIPLDGGLGELARPSEQALVWQWGCPPSVCKAQRVGTGVTAGTSPQGAGEAQQAGAGMAVGKSPWDLQVPVSRRWCGGGAVPPGSARCPEQRPGLWGAQRLRPWGELTPMASSRHTPLPGFSRRPLCGPESDSFV